MVSTKQSSRDESASIIMDRLFDSNKEYRNYVGILDNWSAKPHSNPLGGDLQFADYPSNMFTNMLARIEITTRTVYTLKEDMNDITQILNKMQENQRVMMQKVDDAITEEKDNLKQSLDSKKIFDSETINQSKKNQPRPQKPLVDLVLFVIVFSTLAMIAPIILPTLYSYTVIGFCVLVVVLGIMINRKKNVRYTKPRFNKI